MRSKAPLAMMEQMVMILVFALAAALCLQAFVKSDRMSRESEARDRAAVLCQNAAEAIRAAGGDMESAAALLELPRGSGGDSLMADYDGDWNLAEGTMRYTLGACRVDSGVPGLGTAEVWLRDEAAEEADGELFRIRVSWQEVSGRE